MRVEPNGADSTGSLSPAIKLAVIVVCVAALTALLAVFGLREAEIHGRLSVPPLYDDVSYFVTATRLLNEWPLRSWPANIYAVLDTHAPAATMLAMFGFLLTPGRFLGPYAVNAFVVAGFLVGVAALNWRRRTPEIVAALIAVATVPLLIQTFDEARPDLTWGLALGLAVVLLVDRPVLARPVRSVLGVGIVCGLASIVKPSTLPASFLLVLSSAALAIARDILLTPATSKWSLAKPVLSRGALVTAGFLLGISPVFAIRYEAIAGYIWHTLVASEELWAHPGGFREQATFYYTIGETLALRVWLKIGLALFGARLLLALKVGRADLANACVLLGSVALAYLLPSLTTMKTYFVGAMFFGIFTVAMAMNIVAVADLLRRLADSSVRARSLLKLGYVVPVVLVYFFVRSLQHPVLASIYDPVTRADINDSSERVWTILRSIALQSGDTRPAPSVVFSSPHPVTHATMELYARMAGLRLRFSGVYTTYDRDKALRRLREADIAVVASSIPHNLPGPRMGDQLIAALDASPTMCVLATIPVSGGKMLRVYGKADKKCEPAAGTNARN